MSSVFTFEIICDIIVSSSNRREHPMDRFKLHAPYQPTGDQPQAIDLLTADNVDYYQEVGEN